jgi:hypothetical protein
MPTKRPPLVGEVSAKFADKGCCMVSAADPHDHILGFLDRCGVYTLLHLAFRTSNMGLRLYNLLELQVALL